MGQADRPVLAGLWHSVTPAEHRHCRSAGVSSEISSVAKILGTGHSDMSNIPGVEGNGKKNTVV